MQKSEYKTKQRAALIEYLSLNKERQLSISEVVDSLSDSIGKSTVYRLISQLEKDGIVRRFVSSNGRTCTYQFIGNAHECDHHLHLKCIDCGRVIHLDEKTSDQLLLQILKQNNFIIDESKTVFFGKCISCRV